MADLQTAGGKARHEAWIEAQLPSRARGEDRRRIRDRARIPPRRRRFRGDHAEKPGALRRRHCEIAQLPVLRQRQPVILPELGDKIGGIEPQRRRTRGQPEPRAPSASLLAAKGHVGQRLGQARIGAGAALVEIGNGTVRIDSQRRRFTPGRRC